MVLRTVNAVCGKRKIVKTIIIGDITNLTVDIKWFRKKYKSEDLKYKDYRAINGLIPGSEAIILVVGVKILREDYLIRSGLERTTNHKLDGELFQFWYFQLQRAVIM